MLMANALVDILLFSGDHVITMFLPECNQCRCCTSGKTGTCEVFME